VKHEMLEKYTIKQFYLIIICNKCGIADNHSVLNLKAQITSLKYGFSQTCFTR